MDHMVYCKRCGEWRTDAPSQGADAALGGGSARRRPSAPTRSLSLPDRPAAGAAADPSLSEDELEHLVRLAEKAGDAHVAGRYKQQLQNKKAGDPPLQQRISDCGAKVAELESVLDKEVQKLEQYQQWAAQQLITVTELTERLSLADGEYKTAVSALVGGSQQRASSPPAVPARLSIKEVVDGTGNIADLIDVDSYFDVEGYECTDDDRKHIIERRDQLREQLQEVAKDLFSGAVEKLEAIKKDHADHLARLTKKRKGPTGDGIAAGGPAGPGGAAAQVAGSGGKSQAAAADAKAVPTDKDKQVAFASERPPTRSRLIVAGGLVLNVIQVSLVATSARGECMGTP
ncbi:unnamed protein product, partial [Prorocentrum cordatum]